MLHIAICDDQAHICEDIETELEKAQNGVNYDIAVDVFNDGKDLLDYIRLGNSFDIIYLDIEMENIGGIEVGRTIRDVHNNERTKIIYISAHQTYSMSLHRIRPMDFLVKPIGQKDIEQTIHTAIKLLKKPKMYFTYMKDNNRVRVLVDHIICFESRGRQIKIVKKDGNDYFYGKLSDLIYTLNKETFYSVHKSYIVNYTNIKETSYNEVLMTNGDLIPISQSHRKDIRKKLLDKRFKGKK